MSQGCWFDWEHCKLVIKLLEWMLSRKKTREFTLLNAPWWNIKLLNAKKEFYQWAHVARKFCSKFTPEFPLSQGNKRNSESKSVDNHENGFYKSVGGHSSGSKNLVQCNVHYKQTHINFFAYFPYLRDRLDLKSLKEVTKLLLHFWADSNIIGFNLKNKTDY